MKKYTSPFVFFLIAIVLLAVGAFYGGIEYQKGQSASSLNNRFRNQDAFPSGSRVRDFSNGNSMNFTSGEIIAKDEGSVTVKMQNGSTKIVLFGPTVEVYKSDKGSLEDLVVGENVMVNGKANSDGSLTADSVQIRNMNIPNPGFQNR